MRPLTSDACSNRHVVLLRQQKSLFLSVSALRSISSYKVAGNFLRATSDRETLGGSDMNTSNLFSNAHFQCTRTNAQSDNLSTKHEKG